MAVPRRRIAGPEIGEAGRCIVGAAQPGRGAAGLPQVAGPALVGGAADAGLGLLAVLVVGVAHVSFDHRSRPDQITGARIACFNPADHAKLAAGNAGQQQALGDQWRCGHRITGCVIVNFFFPDDFAGVLVKRDQLCIERPENHQIVEQCSATIDHIATRHDAVRQAVFILP